MEVGAGAATDAGPAAPGSPGACCRDQHVLLPPVPSRDRRLLNQIMGKRWLSSGWGTSLGVAPDPLCLDFQLVHRQSLAVVTRQAARGPLLTALLFGVLGGWICLTPQTGLAPGVLSPQPFPRGTQRLLRCKLHKCLEEKATKNH